MKGYAECYKNALLKDVLPFWINNSPDNKYGGYFSCLDKEGNVYDTDKFIWMQAREVWLFAMLYNRLEKCQDWLVMAKLGIEFLKLYGRNDTGDWYFSLTRQGVPLVQPYSIFSDCFAAMAFSQYALATGCDEACSIARQTYKRILDRGDNPKGKYNKAVPGTRPLKSFALPMILSNLVLEMEALLDSDTVEATIGEAVHEVMEVFLDEEKGVIYEYVLTDGKFSDSFDGRLTNPGHGLEAMWFMLDIAVRRNDMNLLHRASRMIPHLLEWGWDKKQGGIFYFLDALGKPLQQLEWDRKLWWVHLEALAALSKAYRHTGEKVYKQWFEVVHEYTWKHFPDEEGGEWLGYLDRVGNPLLTLKGGKWKGCFHVPRGLYQNWQNAACCIDK